MTAFAANRGYNAFKHENTFLTSLGGFWNMEEASGSRADQSVNANTLTATNSPVGVTGLVFNACNFVRTSSQTLSRVSNSTLQTGGNPFSVTFWVRHSTTPGVQGWVYVQKAPTSNQGLTYEYRIEYIGGVVSFKTLSAPTTGVTLNSTFGSFTNGVWYFISAYFSGGFMGLSVNNGAFDTAAAATPQSSTASFSIGGWNNVVLERNAFLNGDVDACGFWQRKLTDVEFLMLYNNGQGRQPV